MNDSLARELDSRGLDWILPAWGGPRRASALFTTRSGGVSRNSAATLDIGPVRQNPGADEAAEARAIAENRRRLRALLPSDPVWLAQVHGRDVVTIDPGNHARLLRTPPVADAALTRTPGIVLSVRTADCLPLLLSDTAGSVIAVAHAGWRGLSGGVLEATLDAMRTPGPQVTAWIGPAIGPSAFEVGDDVLAAFCATDQGASSCFTPLRDGKWLADLPGLARRRLGARGVRDIASDGGCTYTDAARFFSYRRDRESGRMALTAWLTAVEQ